jgi:hypothetical protein
MAERTFAAAAMKDAYFVRGENREFTESKKALSNGSNEQANAKTILCILLKRTCW